MKFKAHPAKPMSRRAAAGIVLAAFLFVSLAAWSEDCLPPTWKEKTFSYVAEDQDLVQVLGALGASQGLAVVVSPEVKGTVSGSFMNVSPEEFLQSLAAAHGLAWYCDGTGLYVYSSHEVDSLFISLEYLKPADALDLVKKLGIYDSRFPLRSVDNPPMIHVVGPPRYLENISNVLQSAEEHMSRREVRQEEVRVFELKHAWADDIRLPLREGEVRVPGVATTLRRLMVIGDQTTSEPREIVSGGQATGVGGSVPLVQKREGHLNEPAAAQSEVQVAPELATPEAAEGESDYGSSKHMRQQLTPDIRPSIEADTRSNSVIIRDSAARMRLYEDLVRQLDIPVRLVEIQASILDVDADLSFEWGLGMSASFEDEHNQGTINLLTPPRAPTQDTIGNAGALDASWLLLNDHLRFLTVVRALEGQGQARILSRPSLITFANLEAELRDDQTYNVRISGERVAELVSVTAGVQLRVTANLIDPPEGQETVPPGIQLLVHIEDGSFENSNVDGLPVVRTSALNTQAVVGHGQSLLVGGYLKDAAEANTRDVPVVSKVPLVGKLFHSTGRSHKIMQRMFLLTPRMVELDAAMGLDPFESAKRLEAENQLFKRLEQQVKHSKPLLRKDIKIGEDLKPKTRKEKKVKKGAAETVESQDVKVPEEKAVTERHSEVESNKNSSFNRNFSFRKS